MIAPTPDPHALAHGIELMAVGMSTVFAFLGLLVGLMSISGRIFARDAAAAATPDIANGAGVAAAIAIAERWRREQSETPGSAS